MTALFPQRQGEAAAPPLRGESLAGADTPAGRDQRPGRGASSGPGWTNRRAIAGSAPGTPPPVPGARPGVARLPLSARPALGDPSP